MITNGGPEVLGGLGAHVGVQLELDATSSLIVDGDVEVHNRVGHDGIVG